MRDKAWGPDPGKPGVLVEGVFSGIRSTTSKEPLVSLPPGTPGPSTCLKQVLGFFPSSSCSNFRRCSGEGVLRVSRLLDTDRLSGRRQKARWSQAEKGGAGAESKQESGRRWGVRAWGVEWRANPTGGVVVAGTTAFRAGSGRLLRTGPSEAGGPGADTRY